ncbi:MAG: hypothetical protein Q8O29_03730 [Polaromonas sp.]|uniref:hypothetical protein n=1 Tax=Polaromonas sp. TaxID=1869339 RepID=UPI002734276A|nr:hypothetical protein [Polaromonas sp.]MDP2817386.1 hypothetical protein [Polaromonas sp.]
MSRRPSCAICLRPQSACICRAHRPDQLSTLEAVCAALARLEGSAEKFRPLLAAFDGFVAQQMSYLCRHVPQH